MEEMKTSGMVERVAKAIDAAEVAWCAETGKSVADMPVELKARAAIEAMREPSPAMVVAGDDKKDECIDSDWDSDADGNRHDYTTINSDLPALVWRAMVDAALSEPKP